MIYSWEDMEMLKKETSSFWLQVRLQVRVFLDVGLGIYIFDPNILLWRKNVWTPFSDSQQNGLIQIVEVSNGVVSFQFRGLEFKGTYCQQREVEAITEDVNAGCVCCGPRSVSDLCGANGNPFCLSFSSWIRNLAMTWNILQKNYILGEDNLLSSSNFYAYICLNPYP